MKYSVKIKGIGMEVPIKILKNKDIEILTPGSKSEWIKEKLGIEQRHICTTENVVSLGLGAAQRALELAEMFEDEIESIVDKIHELINLDKEEKKSLKGI